MQMIVLAALIAIFAMQIPMSALFFRPVPVKEVVPGAAFVTLDDAAYARLMRQVRTVDWLGASRSWNEGRMSIGTESFVLDDSLRFVPDLPLPDSFTARFIPEPAVLPQLRPSLKPASLAMPSLPPIKVGESVPPASEKRLDPLLDIDSFDSLKERK